jgi:hypothetical protein
MSDETARPEMSSLDLQAVPPFIYARLITS